MLTNDSLQSLSRSIGTLSAYAQIGRVSAIQAGTVAVTGISETATLGSIVAIRSQHGDTVPGEIIGVKQDIAKILVDAGATQVKLGDKVMCGESLKIAPTEKWLGRILDAQAKPIDGRPLDLGFNFRSLTRTPPTAMHRRGLGKRLHTGVAILNTLLPIASGQRLGLFAGSGVGKSSLVGKLVCSMDYDVCVVGLVGERGREVGEFARDVLGETGLKRSVLVAATSDQSPLERRRSAWTATTIAEYFRDQGKNVLLVLDSITRFAEAHREIALASGEAPVLRGYPPSTTHMIAELCERAGTGQNEQGDITAVFSVLVAGSDMEEPVADMLRGVLDGHIVLSREIAEGGRFPAINLLQSVSRSLPSAASKDENQVLTAVRKTISVHEKNKILVQSGLYTHGSDLILDQSLKALPELEKFFGQSDSISIEQSFDQLRLILRRSGIEAG